jgi:class 3 adenylate cyclase
MSATPVKRKLAAILAADAVGYSRLMAADEESTLKLLAAHRAVIDGIIEFHEGRIVNTAGDSVLAEFASPVQAVRCAVEIQDALRTRNDSLPEEKRLQFRIGVNLGDVMVKGEDLLGDGVNVAARLEGVADPGGICISSSVYEQIAGKLDLGFIDVGPKALKNIDRPVRVYRIERDGRSRSTGGRPRTATAIWLVSLAGVAVLALGVWQFALVPMREAAHRVEAEAAARADREERIRQEALQQARAEAEAARKQAEAEKQRAEAEAARRRAEAAKQRAAAKEAKRVAEAQAAEAAEAKRVLEAKEAAEARARAEAEVARLRAEAEEARRKAEAELAAAAQARAKAEESARTAAPAAPAPAPGSTLREGQWTAQISCPPHQQSPARTITAPVSVADDAITIENGKPGEPLSLTLRGVLNSDGTLLLRGSGVSGQRAGSRQYKSAFAARLVGSRYEGSGRLGPRECGLTLSRAS